MNVVVVLRRYASTTEGLIVFLQQRSNCIFSLFLIVNLALNVIHVQVIGNGATLSFSMN